MAAYYGKLGGHPVEGGRRVRERARPAAAALAVALGASDEPGCWSSA